MDKIKKCNLCYKIKSKYKIRSKIKNKDKYPSNNYLPHSKKKIYRDVYYEDDNKENKIITYQMEDEIFDDYSLSIDYFHKDLVIGCNFIENDVINDTLVNRKMHLNKKAAWYLIKDLLKYIFTNRI